MTIAYKNLPRSSKQAVRAAKKLDRTGESRHTVANKNDGYARSDGAVRNHKEAFTVVSKWCEEQPDIKNFSSITPEQAQRFLEEKSVDVQDKTIAGYAVNLEHHLHHNCGYSADTRLVRPPSEVPSILESRAYTKEAVDFIQTKQTTRAALSTQIAAEAGLRAHELFTLRRIEEQPPSDRRAWRDDRFAGRENWARYTVVGKGNLCREVRITAATAARLEAVRLAVPRIVIDRDIRYKSHYDLMGGKSFSNSFSKLSKQLLGHSHGAHGMRHSFAQLRIKELGNAGKSYDQCLLILSQELGHFRPSITEYYLR